MSEFITVLEESELQGDALRAAERAGIWPSPGRIRTAAFAHAGP